MAALDSVSFKKKRRGEEKKRGRQIKRQPVHVSIEFGVGHEHVWELQGEQESPGWERFHVTPAANQN